MQQKSRSRKRLPLSFTPLLSFTFSLVFTPSLHRYKKMAFKHHPDKNPHDKARSEKEFKKVNEAASILNDPDKRAYYDRHGESPDAAPTRQHRQYAQTYASRDMDQEDLFNMFFGGDHPTFPNKSCSSFRSHNHSSDNYFISEILNV